MCKIQNETRKEGETDSRETAQDRANQEILIHDARRERYRANARRHEGGEVDTALFVEHAEELDELPGHLRRASLGTDRRRCACACAVVAASAAGMTLTARRGVRIRAGQRERGRG